MPVEIVRRGAGTKFDSRKLKKTANEILNLLGVRRAIAEADCLPAADFSSVDLHVGAQRNVDNWA